MPTKACIKSMAHVTSFQSWVYVSNRSVMHTVYIDMTWLGACMMGHVSTITQGYLWAACGMAIKIVALTTEFNACS